MIYSEKP
nr:unnamed protein product [Callosobruchus analis]CAI5846654.1 unnamed protein product [Callosobruchus analis]